MRRELHDRLRCPISGEPLQAVTFETGIALGGARSVRSGILWSPAGGYWYPIVNCVPVMLVFPTPLGDDFARLHAREIAALDGAPKRADRAPEAGERSVQITFTEEWGALGDDELSFVYTEEELVALHRDVWLKMPEAARNRVTSVLDVGIGFGKEAVALSRIFPNGRVTGADLNLACIAAGTRLVETTNVDPVVASLFHLPFGKEAFEHVHCQGVLHHTRSTEEGFRAISRQVAPGGSLFVWVYAHEDRHGAQGLKGWLTRAYYWWSHNIFRPVLSRSPSIVRNAVVHVLSVAAHPVFRAIARHRASWRYRNTVHTIRDAFTPRYAHEHGWNEVLEWFETEGYRAEPHSPALYRRLFAGKRLYGIGLIGCRKGPCDVRHDRTPGNLSPEGTGRA